MGMNRRNVETVAMDAAEVFNEGSHSLAFRTILCLDPPQLAMAVALMVTTYLHEGETEAFIKALEKHL